MSREESGTGHDGAGQMVRAGEAGRSEISDVVGIVSIGGASDSSTRPSISGQWRAR